MAVVHRETNWGAQVGTSNHLAQSNPAISQPPNRTTTGAARLNNAARSTGDAECPTVEIDVRLTEARDVTVVAVTTDPELRTALSELLPRGGTLFADSPEQVLSRPAPNNCAVLIVEQTLSRSTFNQLKSHLKESAPALVSIMVGTDDNGSSLVAQLSAGHIDRFMVKPFKFGPTRSALRSALQQHHSLRQCAQVERSAKPVAIESALAVAPSAQPLRTQARAKRGAQTRTIHSAKQTMTAVVQQPPISERPISERPIAERHNAELKGDLKDATDEVVERLSDTARRFSLPSWSLPFAAAIAVLGFAALVVSTRTPELNKDRVIAGHLAAAHRAFELGGYVDPPELSAAHFYSAALELDPMNAEARRGLEAVADRLIANGKEFIVAGDLLRAQSTLDNVRRIQPNHRDLADVTASLFNAREAERVTLQAARSVTKENAAPIASASNANGPVQTALAAPPVVGRASASVDPKVRIPPQRREVQLQVNSAASGRKSVSSSSNSLEKMQATDAIHVSSAADSSLTSSQPAVDLAKRTEQKQLLEAAQNEAAVLGAPKVTSIPAKNPTDAIIGNETVANSAQPTGTGQISAGSVAINPGSTTEAPGNTTTSAASGEPKLVRYVEPVYPYTARVDRSEGWLDVHFLVTSDGSVINPRIEKGSLDSAFRRAAVAAVTQWKYSAAANSAAPNRPMNVRVRFKLADSKHT